MKRSILIIASALSLASCQTARPTGQREAVNYSALKCDCDTTAAEQGDSYSTPGRVTETGSTSVKRTSILSRNRDSITVKDYHCIYTFYLSN